MGKKSVPSFVKCGKAFQPDLPLQLDRSDPPIVLAEVKVNPKLVKRPCVLVKYSEFIKFSLLGLNPRLFILYRLVKESNKKRYPQILQDWEFEIEAAEVLEAGDLATRQPTVLHFCDCLDHHDGERITYKLEIARIETNNVRDLSLSNESISANILSEARERSHNRSYSKRKLPR